MTQHLLAMELGPVVQMIAAARKTRDMYFGSWMLSEIAKAAAASAARQCGEMGCEHMALIAPAPQGMQQLVDEQFAIGDEILVLVPTGIDPADVAARAKQAAHAKWIQFAGEAKPSETVVSKEVWSAQTNANLPEDVAGEVVELYAAWVPLADNYAASLNQVKRLLLGRNACRNFPSAIGRSGVPKSSLDGRRESVLIIRDAISHRPALNRKLRLNEGEHLDALGVTKRTGEGRKNFPSTARLAAEPWIQGAAGLSEFRALIDECQKLAKRPDKDDNQDQILGTLATSEPHFPHYSHFALFPYEGTILYENRHHEFATEADAQESELQGVATALKRVVRRHGEPGKYYVAMVADGDRIGDSLKGCVSHDEHRKFSLRLSEFAAGVRGIVDDHHGALIFAAGEDVSALLPLHSAVQCAEELRLHFTKVVNEGYPGRQATLSVGLAIGHFLDPLEDTLAAARDMEYAAKSGQKNALAIQYRSRGGAPIQFRSSWKSEPYAELKNWITLLENDDLPNKVAYDIRRTAIGYSVWPTDDAGAVEIQLRALKVDLIRLLSRKSSAARAEVQPFVDRLTSPDDAIDLANKIIIAGVIQKAQQQARGVIA